MGVMLNVTCLNAYNNDKYRGNKFDRKCTWIVITLTPFIVCTIDTVWDHYSHVWGGELELN